MTDDLEVLRMFPEVKVPLCLLLKYYQQNVLEESKGFILQNGSFQRVKFVFLQYD